MANLLPLNLWIKYTKSHRKRNRENVNFHCKMIANKVIDINYSKRNICLKYCIYDINLNYIMSITQLNFN